MSSAADFDFLIGDWHISNEKLSDRLVGSTIWQRFDAATSCRKILNDSGNFDEMIAAHSRFAGLSLRVFNPGDRLWSIHWLDNARHRVVPPMVGHFNNGIGQFYGEEKHQGRTVLARFIWKTTPDAPVWEQAFSEDNGDSWETNWVMRFYRRG